MNSNSSLANHTNPSATKKMKSKSKLLNSTNSNHFYGNQNNQNPQFANQMGQNSQFASPQKQSGFWSSMKNLLVFPINKILGKSETHDPRAVQINQSTYSATKSNYERQRTFSTNKFSQSISENQVQQKRPDSLKKNSITRKNISNQIGRNRPQFQIKNQNSKISQKAMKKIQKKVLIEDLLQKYGIKKKQLIQTALKLKNNLQDWQDFILVNVFKGKREMFVQELRKIFGNEQIQSSEADLQSLLSAYSQIHPRQIEIHQLITTPLQQSKWSDELMNQVQLSLQADIIQAFTKSKKFWEFELEILEKAYDLIARRIDLETYFQKIKTISKKYSTEVAKILSKIHFNDFVILFINSINDKSLVGKLLSEVGIGIPLFYTISNNQFKYYPELLKNTILSNNYYLVLNMGSPSASKCGKSKLISSLLSLNRKGSYESMFKNLLTVFTKFALGMNQKTLFADFNGCLQEDSPQIVIQKILQLTKRSSLIFLHIKESEIQNDSISTFENPYYQKLCSIAQKIVLIVRDAQNFTQSSIKQILPQKIKNKTLVYVLENLANKPDAYRQQQTVLLAKAIFERGFNSFDKPQLQYSALITDQKKQKIKKYNNIVERLMKELKQKNFKKQKILPFITITDLIFEKGLQKKRRAREEHETQKQYFERFDRIEKEYEELIQKKNQTKLSRFGEIGYEILNLKDKQCHQLVVDKITDWKNEKLFPLKEKYIEITNLLHDKKGDETNLKQKILKITEQIGQYQISLDSLINQIILSNGQKKDENVKNLINHYYTESFKSLKPINIIDGKTLNFGNPELEQLFVTLSKKYQQQKKPVYVISVIGAQSSAKSTLMNMLFRCSFQTSAGRCTKGVYFNICEIQGMVIVVLDTEGLLSVSARDTAFDNQIATFVFKVSNVIIINNKGELTSTMKQLLKVCMYVLECLYKDLKKQDYTPQKIMFTLRDQTKPKGKHQEQMVSQIKNQLQTMKSNDSIDYQNFFSIETQDIFSLPNVFEQRNGITAKCGSYNAYYPIFGACMLALRNRIIKVLKNSTPQKNLYSFYTEAKGCWNILQICGQNILNYKSINQIFIKNKLQQLLQQKLPQFKVYIQNKYNQFVQRVENYSLKQLQNSSIEEDLKYIQKSNQKYITEKYMQIAAQNNISKQNASIMHSKIRDICSSYSVSYYDWLFKRIKSKQSQQKTKDFKMKLKNIIEDLLIDKNFTDAVIQKKIQQQKNKLQDSFNVRLEKHQTSKQRHNTQFEQVFQSLLGTQGQQSKLKIDSLQSCIEKYQGFQKNRHTQARWAQHLIATSCKFFKGSEEWRIIKQCIQRCIDKVSLQIKYNVESANILNTSQIQVKFKNWVGIMELKLAQLKGDLHKFNQKNSIVFDLKLNQNIFRALLFAVIFNTAKDCVFDNNKRVIENELAETRELIELQHEQVKKAIKSRGKIAQTLQNWSKTLIDKISKQNKDYCFEQTQTSLLKLKNKLDQQAIISSSIAKSFQATQGKQKWRQCFKMVRNINKYLLQIMCTHEQVVTYRQLVTSTIKKVKQLSKTKLQKKIFELSNLKLNDEKKVTLYMQQNDMLYIQNQNFTKQDILKKFQERLKNQKITILNQINDRLDAGTLQTSVQKFIENEMKNKIIGCQHTCPICKMKCKKQAFHSDDQHEVMKGCHTLCAFGDARIYKTNTPCYKGCFTSEALTTEWINGQESFEDCKELIKKKYPQWDNHFPGPTDFHLFQGDQQVFNFRKIWANIEDMVIKYVYKTMIKDGKYQDLKRPDSLTEADLDLEYLNYKGEKVSIRKVYLS